MKKLLFIFIIAVSSIYAKPCMTDIYFGNGVWNTEEEGQEGRDELKLFMQYRANSRLDIQKEGIYYDFKHAYNQSVSTTDDLIETFYQLKESGQISNGYFQWIFTLLNRDESIEPYQKLQDIVRTHNEDAFYMFTKYDNESFKKKHNVLLVAHSQGNLFGNKMYTLMSDAQKKKFRMVSVATPANHIAGYVNGGPYVTATGDYVIRPIPGSLPSNIAGFGHTFIGTYLNIDGAGVPGDGSNNAPKIIGLHVKTAYNNLMQTASCSEYKYYVWISYLCPTRKAQELAVDIYGRPADAPYSYKKELVATDSRARMPQNINGNCSVSGDDMLSLFNEYDKDGCTAYSLDDTTGNSRSVDTVKANIYNNGYLCTQYKMKPEVVSVLKSMESF